MAGSDQTLSGLTPSVTFLENTVNATPQIIDADVTFADLDGDVAWGKLTVSGLLAEDTVSIRNQGTGAGQISLSGSNVFYEGTFMGVAAGGTGDTLTVVFVPTATAAAVDALIQNLTYANSSHTPTASRTLALKITDADGNTALAPATFAPQTGTANPFDGVDVGVRSTPSLGDLDGDGDLDAVVGTADGTLRYFQNTGSAVAPVFFELTGAANPFNSVDLGEESAPSFADLDGDGDLDAVVGENAGNLNYLENTGTATTPAFVLRTGAANPFNGVNVGGTSSKPSFADLDGDGDLDAVVGEGAGNLNYFENTGTATTPTFVLRTGAANPFDGVDVGFFSAPSFADLDGDGDLDAVVGEEAGILNYFENTGTATTPTFVLRTGAANPFNGVDVGFFSAPSFADLDGDGDLDILGGNDAGTLPYFVNTTPSATAPSFTAVTGAANPFNGFDVGSNSTPAFADLDGDGALDAVVGEYNGNLNYFRNTGSATVPIFVSQTGAANPFNGIDLGQRSDPSFADLDGDGDLDAVVGEYDGTLNYFENTGTATAPAFVQRTGAANPFNGVDVEYSSAPSFADLDGDGDLDAVVGSSDGTLFYFKNTGTANTPTFVAQTGTDNPFNAFDVGAGSAPSFADLDHDGDLDAVVGTSDGTLFYFENTGTVLAPAFVQRTGSANPFDGVDVGAGSAPAFADLDHDGDLDLFVGDDDGTLNYFRNDRGFELVVNVTAENDAPVNTVPGAQTVAEDTDLAITGLSISDIDVGAGAIVVVLSVQHGTIHVRDDVPGGVVALGILFNDTNSVTISGTPALVNATLAALNGVIYRGDLDYVGPDTLTMMSNDLGNTGGSSLNDIDTVNITVTPVNDTPDNNEPGPGGNSAFLSYTENQAPTAINTTLSFTDPDDLTLPFGRVSIVSGYQANQDVLGFVNDGASMGNIAVVSNLGGVLTLGSAGDTATVAQWNNALRAVTYFNSSDTPSTVNRVLSYQVDDGDGFVVVDDATIGITATNDAANDFNGDGKSDVLFQHANGTPAIWLLDGTTVTAQAIVGANPGTAWHAIGSGDINGDEKADILFQHDNGTVAAYQMNGTTILSQATLGTNPGPSWNLIASGDFNGDHKDDLLWQHDDGSVGAWLMNGNSVSATAFLGQNPGPAWNVIGTGDFNGDGKADVLWQNDNGTAGIWLMDGTDVLSTAAVSSNPGTAWTVIGAGDFNADGRADILWQHDNGTVGIWLMDGTSVLSTAGVGTNPGSAWNVIGAFDVNGDGKSDILFQHDDGTPGVWLMDGTAVTATSGIGTNPGAAWDIVPHHDLVV